MTSSRINQVFAAAARETPDRTHLVFEDGTTATYAQTYARAASLAGAFAAAGIAPGDRMAGFMRNSREVIEFFVACGIANVIGVALNGMSTKRELTGIFADCTPRGIMAEAGFLDRVPDFDGLRLRVATQTANPPGGWVEYEALIASATPAKPRAEASADDPAMMIYSSGTTGAPKGILLRHSGLVENARLTQGVLKSTAQDRHMTVLPLFSSFGFAFDFVQVGLLRASVVLQEQFDEKQAVELIARHRVTFMAAVPTMLARMFDPGVTGDLDLTCVRLIDVGGGPVAPQLKAMLAGDYGIEVVESYGLTEISPVASVQAPADASALGSCGAPLPGIDCRVMGLDGALAGVDQPGELQFRGPTLMNGYWNQPELTTETLKDGWLRSGDIGKIDPQGNIHILDRTKDMIVANGFNVYPKEVENVIAELDEVQSVAVVGMNDDIEGERIHGFVVLKPGAVLSEQQVLERCTAGLSSYKRPRNVHFIDAMPLTGSGKIRRVQLRDILARNKKETP